MTEKENLHWANTMVIKITVIEKNRQWMLKLVEMYREKKEI